MITLFLFVCLFVFEVRAMVIFDTTFSFLFCFFVVSHVIY